MPPVSKRIKYKVEHVLHYLMSIILQWISAIFITQNPTSLLIATILSAQCTDDRVNIVIRNTF